MNNKPIGMFDSGVGGFTLVKEVFKILPNEEIIYFGDTARSPYGTKTDKEILNYSRQIVDFLISKDVKLVIIACNTATVTSIDSLQKEYNIPIIGVVEPAVQDVVSKRYTRKIGLIATDSTVESKQYEKIIKNKDSNLQVLGKACPELVTLAEKGIFNNEVSNIAVKKCLENLLEEEIDTLILGCTHFPLHLKDIKKNIPETIRIVNPAIKTIEVTSNILRERDMFRKDSNRPRHRFMCNGDIESFTKAYNIIFEEER